MKHPSQHSQIARYSYLTLHTSIPWCRMWTF